MVACCVSIASLSRLALFSDSGNRLLAVWGVLRELPVEYAGSAAAGAPGPSVTLRRRFKCEHCDDRTVALGWLTRHRQLHDEARPERGATAGSGGLMPVRLCSSDTPAPSPPLPSPPLPSPALPCLAYS